LYGFPGGIVQVRLLFDEMWDFDVECFCRNILEPLGVSVVIGNIDMSVSTKTSLH